MRGKNLAQGLVHGNHMVIIVITLLLLLLFLLLLPKPQVISSKPYTFNPSLWSCTDLFHPTMPHKNRINTLHIHYISCSMILFSTPKSMVE